MAHMVSERSAITARVKRIGGQVAAIERQLDEDADCTQVLQLVASVRGAINGLMEELIEDHLRDHVMRPGLSEDARREGIEDMLAIIRRYGK